jgi:hypothetical protein
MDWWRRVAGSKERRKATIDATDKILAKTEWKGKMSSGVDLKNKTDGTDCIHTHACVYKIHTRTSRMKKERQ